MTSADLIARLRARFAAPEYALFEEVGDATGGRSRSIDALAMSLWPSRGLEVYGFEVKVSRHDWKRELTNPAKAETFARFCDRWWLVAGDEKIVDTGELPPTWGLLVPRGDGLRAIVEAPKLTPEALSRKFIAAICRAAHKDAPTEFALKRARLEGEKIGAERAESNAEHRRKYGNDELTAIKHAVEEFEKASGVKIANWNGKRIGEAVAAVLDIHAPDREFQLEHAAHGLEEAAKTTRALLKVIRARGKEAAE